MNLKEIPTIGKVALLTGLGQIIFTSLAGFALGRLLGLGFLPAVYTAIALTFSSTIIVVKLLSEKGDLQSLYGKIAIGFLLVQDFVAILILIFLSGVSQGGMNVTEFILISAKAAGLLFATWALSRKILPYLFDKLLGGSQEAMFVGSLAWALGISALVGGPLGFSFEIGGFLAGLALSSLPEHLEISSKTRPLRDFFLTIFFLTLGAQLVVSDFTNILTPAIILSVFVLVGNPLIVMTIMGLLRYRKRTAFLASTTVAQISEFSFILMAMGLTLGHVTESNVAMVVVVGVITMTASTYIIMGSNKIYSKIQKYLSFFEKKNTREEVVNADKEYKDHIVLVGYDRMGRSLGPFLKRKNVPFVVVDYDPRVFGRLTADKTDVVLGDMADEEILAHASVKTSKMIISTVSNFNDNVFLLSYIKNLSPRPPVVLKSTNVPDAIKLYELGASYVLVPEVVTGEFLRHIFNAHGIGEKTIKHMGKSHFRRLVSRV